MFSFSKLIAGVCNLSRMSSVEHENIKFVAKRSTVASRLESYILIKSQLNPQIFTNMNTPKNPRLQLLSGAVGTLDSPLRRRSAAFNSSTSSLPPPSLVQREGSRQTVSIFTI